jgi:hypothetical protein
MHFNDCHCFQRDSVTRFFASGFFDESVFPQPQSILLELFQIFSKNRRDFRKSRPPPASTTTNGKFGTGVNDTGGKIAASISHTSGKFATGLNDTDGKYFHQFR